MEIIDRLAITQGQNIVQTTVKFSGKEKIENMDKLGITQRKNIVETTVGIFQDKNRLKLGMDWL